MKKIFSFLVSVLLLTTTIPVFAATATLSAVPTTTIASAATATAVFTRSLGIGASGQDVEALKKILSLEVGSTDTGSTYTSTTAAAVSEFQNKYAAQILIPLGLTAPTGYVGPSTIAQLNQIAASDNITLSQFPVIVAPVPGQTFTQTLSLGSTGSQVSLLKNVLESDLGITLSATDVFDQATENAVDQFQQKYAAAILTPLGLSAPTGIVGSATRAKLNAILEANLALAQSAGSATISTTTASLSGNTSVGGSSVSNSGTEISNTDNGIGTDDSQSVCPMQSISYSAWGPCLQNGTQTRTATAAITGYSSECSNGVFTGNAKPITTQSCTIQACPTNSPITFEGDVATIAECFTIPYSDPYVAVNLEAGGQYTDSSGNACTMNGVSLAYDADDAKNNPSSFEKALTGTGSAIIDVMDPLGTILDYSTLEPWGEWESIEGVFYNAPGGANTLGITTGQTVQCGTVSGSYKLDRIDVANTYFNIPGAGSNTP